jgi:hypothetical protein
VSIANQKRSLKMSEMSPNDLPPSERPPQPPRPSGGWEQEKEAEKTEEKEREKGGYEGEKFTEKYRRDPIGGIFAAAILIWLGLVFLAENLGLLPRFGELEVGHWIAMGIGGLLLVEAFVRLTSAEHRRNVTGRLIFGGILLLLGLSGALALDFETIWPAFLIVIGLFLLARVFFWRQ